MPEETNIQQPEQNQAEVQQPVAQPKPQQSQKPVEKKQQTSKTTTKKAESGRTGLEYQVEDKISNIWSTFTGNLAKKSQGAGEVDETSKKEQNKISSIANELSQNQNKNSSQFRTLFLQYFNILSLSRISNNIANTYSLVLAAVLIIFIRALDLYPVISIQVIIGLILYIIFKISWGVIWKILRKQ